MLTGQMYINGKDAYKTWGIFLGTDALSALMTPPPFKEFISNTFRSKDGKRIVKNNPRFDARDITIAFNMTAKTEKAFLANYASFCEELAKGYLVIRTSFQPSVYYRCTYTSCTQFSQYNRELAKFSLKLNEPDPTNRSETDKYSDEE